MENVFFISSCKYFTITCWLTFKSIRDFLPSKLLHLLYHVLADKKKTLSCASSSLWFDYLVVVCLMKFSKWFLNF